MCLVEGVPGQNVCLAGARREVCLAGDVCPHAVVLPVARMPGPLMPRQLPAARSLLLSQLPNLAACRLLCQRQRHRVHHHPAGQGGPILQPARPQKAQHPAAPWRCCSSRHTPPALPAPARPLRLRRPDEAELGSNSPRPQVKPSCWPLHPPAGQHLNGFNQQQPGLPDHQHRRGDRRRRQQGGQHHHRHRHPLHHNHHHNHHNQELCCCCWCWCCCAALPGRPGRAGAAGVSGRCSPLAAPAAAASAYPPKQLRARRCGGVGHRLEGAGSCARAGSGSWPAGSAAALQRGRSRAAAQNA